MDQTDGGTHPDLFGQTGGLGHQQLRHRNGIDLVYIGRLAMVLADIGIAKPQLIGEDNFIDIFIIRLRRGSVQAKPVSKYAEFHECRSPVIIHHITGCLQARQTAELVTENPGRIPLGRLVDIVHQCAEIVHILDHPAPAFFTEPRRQGILRFMPDRSRPLDCRLSFLGKPDDPFTPVLTGGNFYQSLVGENFQIPRQRGPVECEVFGKTGHGSRSHQRHCTQHCKLRRLDAAGFHNAVVELCHCPRSPANVKTRAVPRNTYLDWLLTGIFIGHISVYTLLMPNQQSCPVALAFQVNARYIKFMSGNDPENARRPFWVWLLIGSIAVVGLLYLLSWQFPGVLSDGDAQPYLAHHVIFLVVLASALMAGRDTGAGMMLRHAAIWVAIGAVTVMGYSYRSDFKNMGNRIIGELRPDMALTTGDGNVAIRRSSDGHFRLTATVDGKPVRFLVDTGASLVALSPGDARAIGFDTDHLQYGLRIQTANGTAWSAAVLLAEISVGTIRARNVRAAVSQSGLSESLLGLAFLNRLSSYEVRGDTMILKP